MIRDITIGQYYPADSVIHKLDPRTKLVGTIGFIVSVFLFHTFAGYAVATIFLLEMIPCPKFCEVYFKDEDYFHAASDHHIF